LAIELEKAGIIFRSEQEMPIFYDNKDIGRRRVDFLVENSVMVELKTLTQFEEVH
jgi:GxxExxY protein